MISFDIITIFPRALDSYWQESIIKRAQAKKLIKIISHNLRDYSTDKHHKVDDKPYGGGVGMVMMAEPIIKALSKLKVLKRDAKSAFDRIKRSKKNRVILLAANGKQFTQKDARRLSKYDRLVFICGRYEGVDARVEKFIDEKISVGPYVVTGGELPAALIIDAVARLIPGVVGKEESIINESFSAGCLEHPHYTRPEKLKFNGRNYLVPKILLRGNHKKIQSWRQSKSPLIKSW